MTGNYFGVAVWHPKTEANIGTLWRSARTFRAAMLATVGPRRYQHQSTDTTKAPRSIPLMGFTDVDDLLAHLPTGCELIGVELADRAKPLHQFTHPDRALYLLGAEDRGLPVEVLERCDRLVQIASPEPWSLNVATAGSMVMYDRFVKMTA